MNAEDLKQIATEGYCLLPDVVDALQVQRLVSAVGRGETTRAGSRNARRLLESCPTVAELADSRAIREVVEPVLGAAAFVVRGLLFDKVEGANWQVAWHQDLMIPVRQQIETPGFSAWSSKQGVVHVCPPAEVLAGMLTVRVHLDDCPQENGPLMVLPGTHQRGILSTEQSQQLVAESEPEVCLARAGDVLVMRPLLLHASRPASSATHRRVVHLEYATQPLPGLLQWWQSTAT
ncbi:phytanoyl-CoA dioxygenase family protein [Aeoliella mucimassa]|uniref:Phytanoyl-CoA dioxygenase (PhyH) n=1 Tax=Aeoliella mucimassa TaxID=2527972 RepID=A0A518AGW4_9BACT|nr:phytanoyl-CoA dioxygenase family protein [Aeoliella mucimassa]QDU53970.1 Phytanoyl-CoA dioxygenase (PhyH) [Aeoliella mucimassa]